MIGAGSFDHARAHVEAMIETGEPFDAVVGAIAESRLPEDEEAALWLVAWSLDDRREDARRRPRLRAV